MPKYLNNCPIAICDRCGFKFPWKSLRKDGNSPGLMVCDSDWDPKNPWREAPILADRIALRWSRPDVPLGAGEPYPDLTNPNPANSVPPNYNSYPTKDP